MALIRYLYFYQSLTYSFSLFELPIGGLIRSQTPYPPPPNVWMLKKTSKAWNRAYKRKESRKKRCIFVVQFSLEYTLLLLVYIFFYIESTLRFSPILIPHPPLKNFLDPRLVISVFKNCSVHKLCV